MDNPDQLFKAFSDSTRLRLLNLLAQREHCVCEFQSILRVPQPKISRHLAYLRRSGLVKSCRSQMTEGWARHLKADSLEPYSAGIEKHGMNPYAIKVMAEAGVDITGHHSKTVAELGSVEFDYVSCHG